MSYFSFFSMLRLTFKNQHDEDVVETSRYLFELPICFDSSTSHHQYLKFVLRIMSLNILKRS